MTVDDKIKVFDAEDSKLKILGELLSNDTSRKIIRMLIRKECYTNEISKKLDIRVSLVIHHLKKLEELGVLEITHKQIVKKGNDHRYFRMVPGMFLAPNHTKEEIDKSGFLKKIFREGIKFASIGIAGMIVWFSDLTHTIEASHSLPFPVPFGESDDFEISSLVPVLIVIILGLIIERIFSARKKRKND